jgi:site-specific DNA recombinase
MTIRVGTYNRISTDETNQPYSLDAQTVALERLVDALADHEIVLRYSDQKSGATLDRPGLQQMLRDAQAGKFDVLMVYRLDRLSRSTKNSLLLMEQLAEYGVEFRSATEPFDTTPSGVLTLSMLAAFAEHERAVMIDRIKAGQERKAASGKWVGGPPPYGYDLIDGVLVSNLAEGVIVVEVFRRYVELLEGTRNIAAWLNDNGYRNRKGKRFHFQQILRMLTNRVYLSEIRWNDDWHQGSHEPLILTDLFDRANALLRARGDDLSLRRSNTSDYLLTGLVRCAHCGRSMVGATATGRSKKYPYYVCHTRHRYDSNACQTDRIPARDLEAAVAEQVIAMLENEPLVREAVEDAFASQESDRPRRAADLASVATEIQKAEAAVSSYLDAFEDGSMPKSVCGPRLEELGTKLRSLEARQQELTDQDDEILFAPDEDELLALAAAVREVVANGDTRQIKALMQAYVREIRVVNRDEIYPSFYAPVVSPPSQSVEAAGIEPA